MIAALRRRRAPLAFYRRDVAEVARALIGCALVHGARAGTIVEVEAYGGPDDLASHARFGPTARTSVMFEAGGVSYVYLCYGVHEMFNLVTGAAGDGQAVLVRAIAPLVGFGGADGRGDDPRIGRGPGKVTRALGLDRTHDRRALDRGDLFVALPAADAPAPPIAITPRIGVDFAGEWARAPLRFVWDGHPAVSAARAPRSVATRRSRSRNSSSASARRSRLAAPR